MTQDEIIRIAREAGFVVTDVNGFLELKLCHPTPRAKSLWKMFERFAALVAANEREACAKVCEELGEKGYVAEGCAAAIRARSNNG